MEEGTATGGDSACFGDRPRADSAHPLVRLVVDLPAKDDRLAYERGVPSPAPPQSARTSHVAVALSSFSTSLRIVAAILTTPVPRTSTMDSRVYPGRPMHDLAEGLKPLKPERWIASRAATSSSGGAVVWDLLASTRVTLQALVHLYCPFPAGKSLVALLELIIRAVSKPQLGAIVGS